MICRRNFLAGAIAAAVAPSVSFNGAPQVINRIAVECDPRFISDTAWFLKIEDMGHLMSYYRDQTITMSGLSSLMRGEGPFTTELLFIKPTHLVVGPGFQVYGSAGV